MSTYFPRVLIVNYYAFNQKSGGAITMTNLFKEWPSDKIALVHTDIYGNDSDKGIDHYLRRELVLPGMRRGVRWTTQEEMARNNNDKTGGKLHNVRMPIYRAAARSILNKLGVAPLMQRYPITKELQKFVDAFKPQALYTHLNDMPFAEVVLTLSKRYNLPIIVHIMDDYAATFYREGLFANFVRMKMHSQLSEIFSRAALCMGISQAMCDEYSERYGKPFLPFHNPIDLSVWGKESSRDTKIKKNHMRIVYSGRIGLAANSSILDICRVVGKFNDPGLHIEFTIHVNSIQEAFRIAPALRELPRNVRLMEAPAALDEMVSILTSADILLLPVDFDEASIEYIRLSMPTKVSAYMATGRPILAYGPKSVASIQYAMEKGWALVVNERSDEKLRAAIQRLAHDSQLRATISEKARNLVKSDHEASRVCASFNQAIIGAVYRD